MLNDFIEGVTWMLGFIATIGCAIGLLVGPFILSIWLFPGNLWALAVVYITAFLLFGGVAQIVEKRVRA